MSFSTRKYLQTHKMLCSSETLLVWKGNTFLVPNKNKKQLLCMRYSTLHVLSSFRNGPCVFSILYQPNALWLPTLFMLLYVWFLCEKLILFPWKVNKTNSQLSVHLVKASDARILYLLKKKGNLHSGLSILQGQLLFFILLQKTTLLVPEMNQLAL